MRTVASSRRPLILIAGLVQSMVILKVTSAVPLARIIPVSPPIVTPNSTVKWSGLAVLSFSFRVVSTGSSRESASASDVDNLAIAAPGSAEASVRPSRLGDIAGVYLDEHRHVAVNDNLNQFSHGPTSEIEANWDIVAAVATASSPTFGAQNLLDMRQ